jgi:hypothetical protein
MHTLPNHNIHTRQPHIALRALGRNAAIVVAVALSAALVTASEQNAVRASKAAVAQEAPIAVNVPLGVEIRAGTRGATGIVRGLDPSAINAISIVNEQGEPIVTALTIESGLRFEDVPAGRYRIVVSSEGPVIAVDGSAISSAIVVRSELFSLVTGGVIVVESR